jgi:hypothetical protein
MEDRRKRKCVIVYREGIYKRISMANRTGFGISGYCQRLQRSPPPRWSIYSKKDEFY